MNLKDIYSLCAALALAAGGRAQAPSIRPLAFERAADDAPRPPRSASDPTRWAPPMPVAFDSIGPERFLTEDAIAPSGSPLRIGIVREIVPIGAQHGIWLPLDDGGWIWVCDLELPGAKGLRLRIRGFDSSHVGELRSMNIDQPSEFAGPFLGTQRDELWTPTIHGPRVRLEYEIRATEAPSDLDPRFTIDALLAVYRDLAGDSAPDGSPDESLLPCHLDINCYPQWLFEGAGVGRLSYIQAGQGWVCSGAVLNRFPGDFSPLFMTANHCEISEANDHTVEVVWLYRSVACDGGVPSIDSFPDSIEARLLVSDPSTDFRLLGLPEAPPFGTTFLGWDANYWPNGSPATSIHHPGGTFQRISFGTKQENLSSCVGGESWRVRYLVNDGPLQGGSSGSPVLDASGLVRGTASCSDDNDCNQHDNGVHGRFDFAYSRLVPFLDPVDPVYVDRANTGPEQGSAGQPFNRFADGVFAVIAGSTVWIRGGAYGEPLTIRRAMTLRAFGGDAVIGG